MDRSTVQWRGYWPAAPTPFSADGALDEGAIGALLGQYVDDGVHGILVNGSSGEWWAQSNAERRRVAELAIAAVAGRVPVVIGCTGFTPEEVIDLAAHAAEAGADGVLCTPPPYAHPTQEEVLAFYSAVDRAIELPLIAYNWPRGTGLEIELETAKWIADLEHVVAIKNSTAHWPLVVDCIEALADRVRIFASLINRRGLAIIRELGGDGYIDGGGIGAPFAVPFFESLWQGDLDEARRQADRYWQLTAGLIRPDFGGRFGSPSSQLKAAMDLLGQPGGQVRSPLEPTTDPEAIKQIGAILVEAGLLRGAAA
ncbi:MAG TPA: dihydrodipicolinate synthase family protein [Solirubrobacterales bacterium]|nr:dihydrodipicolinate synthase family protein [Solirubrobacterales bacterium]